MCPPLQQFKDADRIYLPIFWVGLVKDGPDGWRAALQKLIAKLDTRCDRVHGLRSWSKASPGVRPLPDSSSRLWSIPRAAVCILNMR